MSQQQTKVLWISDLCKRYQRDRATIWRWLEDKKLPDADLRIGKRRGWYLSTIERFERESVQAK